MKDINLSKMAEAVAPDSGISPKKYVHTSSSRIRQI
jgi:hypothetical protein